MNSYGKSWFTAGSLIGEFSDRMRMSKGQDRSTLAVNTARVEAELASKSKSEFIASMSHELRTPLNAILGFSDMLKSHKDLPVEQTDQYAGYIHEAAQHLLQLINEILDVSKIQAGALTVDLQVIDVRPILESCLHFIEMRAATKGITVICNIDEDISRVRADALRLKQVLLNLLSNAVKFTDKDGSVTVDVTNDRPGYVGFCITDTGRGMTREEVQLATQPFGQVHTRNGDHIEGTGLGLPISVALIKSHNGKFTLESQQDTGTCIRFIIPTDAGHDSQDDAEIVAAHAATPHPDTNLPTQPAH